MNHTLHMHQTYNEDDQEHLIQYLKLYLQEEIRLCIVIILKVSKYQHEYQHHWVNEQLRHGLMSG